jgi:excisionase family DNA binding protein
MLEHHGSDIAMITYTTGRAAKMCGVGHQTIIRAFDKGEIEGFRLPPGCHRRIPDFALKAWCRSRKIPIDHPEANPACPTTAPAASASS